MDVAVKRIRDQLMDLPLDVRTELAYEVLDSMPDDHQGETGAGEDSLSAEAIARRVEEIRNGAPLIAEEREVFDEMGRVTAESDDIPLDDVHGGEGDEDPAEVEAAWAEEIRQRVAEIGDGTAKTYAAEDVMVALRLRYG